MRKIFISYRRSDSEGHAGRLWDRLSACFGQNNVFMDVDSIDLGEQFTQVLEDALSTSGVLVALIGTDWLGKMDGGRRKIDQRDDFVHQEIAAALGRDIRIVPVLVKGARMPEPKILPADLRTLTTFNALELRHTQFDADVGRLIETLQSAIREAEERQNTALRELSNHLADYRRLRRSSFGPERTKEIHTLGLRVGALALRSGLTHEELMHLPENDRDDGIFLLLAVAQLKPDVRYFRTLLDAVQNPSGPQEQYLALRGIAAMLPSLRQQQRQEVALIVKTQQYLVRENEGRWNLRGEILSLIEGKGVPDDYLFLNHTSFLRDDKQAEFRERTGVPLPHYDIRVILDSYHDGALARVQRVEFILPKAYPERIQTRTDRQNKFMLKELANGEYLLRAKVFLNDESNPVVLNRYITLWKDGPIL